MPTAKRAAFPPVSLSLAVCGVAALFYLAAFYLRVSPAVMTTELMRDFHIGAAELGNLSGFYYYAYVVMQIPAGVLVDSLSAKRLLLLGTLAAAAGTVVFALAPGFAVANLGRALVGGATACAWVITMKLAAHWLPNGRFALAAGVTLFAGNMGALVAQVPLRLLLEHFDWRTVSLGSAAVVVAIAVLGWFIVANDPADRGYQTYASEAVQSGKKASLRDLLAGVPGVFAAKNTWLIFLAQGGFVGAMLSFTGLWGPPFLRARFNIPATTAAAVCSVMTICWAVASPLCGYLSDRFGRRKPIYVTGALIAAIGWPVLFYVDALPLPAFIAVAAVTSFACGAVILGFAFAKESVPARFLGTITGAINMGNQIGPMLLQPAIGLLLEKNWSGAMSGTTRVYDVAAFHAAFALIAAWAALTGLLLAFTSETFCRQMNTE
jgi:MFS family permease